MNICVCVKYIPKDGDIILDEAYNLDRKTMPGEINPFDLYALEAANRIKDEYPDTNIIAISMGSDDAKRALKECMALGIDDIYLISDDRLKGADVSVTAKVLAKMIRLLEKRHGSFDAVFCGSKTVDGAMSQLGMRLSAILDVPGISYGLTSKLNGDELEVLAENDEGNRIYSVKLPALVTFTKAEFDTRYPRIDRIIASEHADIPVYSLDDIELESNDMGKMLKVINAGAVKKEKQGLMIQEKLAEDSAHKLSGILFEEHLI